MVGGLGRLESVRGVGRDAVICRCAARFPRERAEFRITKVSGVGGSVLFPHQSRRYSAVISYAQSVTAVAFISLFAVISPRAARAEYFVPTSLGGSLSYGYGYSRVSVSESEQSIITLSLDGGGYFWQPWFITMGAGIGLGLSKADSTGGSGNTAKTVSGSVDFTLFPESRFPTNVGFAVSDSRQEAQDSLFFGGQNSQTRRFYVRQAYNTEDGANINAWYNRNSGSTSYQAGESIDQSLGFQIRKRVAYHDFGLGGGYFENDPAQSDIKSSNSNLLLSHNYFPSAEVGVNSVASYSGAATAGGGAPKFTSTYEQLSSSFYWRPEHRPYYISGGALIFTVLSGNTSRGVSTNANAAYQFAHNLSVTAGLGVSVTDSDGKQSVSSTQSVATSIPSEQYTIFGFDYGWSVGVGFSNSVHRSETNTVTGSGSSGTETKNQQSMNVSASHHLGRTMNLGRYSGMNIAFGQSVSGSKSSDIDYISRSVSNSASLGWNHSGFGGNTTAGASVSDSRSFGQQGSAFQVFSAQLARNQELSRLSSLSGSINFQASRNDTPISDNATGAGAGSASVVSTGSTTKSASASFGYTHSRFFGVHGMMFSSRLSVPTLLKDERTQSTSPKDWDNTLAYRIGMLALNLTARATESGPGQRAYSMTFQAVRSF